MIYFKTKVRCEEYTREKWVTRLFQREREREREREEYYIYMDNLGHRYLIIVLLN